MSSVWVYLTNSALPRAEKRTGNSTPIVGFWSINVCRDQIERKEESKEETEKRKGGEGKHEGYWRNTYFLRMKPLQRDHELQIKQFFSKNFDKEISLGI